MDTMALLGTLFGLGLGSGVRLYATVLAIGLGIRLNWFHLHPGLQQLDVLAHTWVLVAAGVAYFLEFFADKIPYADSLWDTVHTVIRPIGAAALGATVAGNFDTPVKVAIAILCGGIALTGHTGKAGTRLMVNMSPEPVTNIVTSLLEDVLAIAWAWLTITHPLITLGIAIAVLALFLWLAPKIFRAIRNRVRAGWRWLTGDREPAAPPATALR